MHKPFCHLLAYGIWRCDLFTTIYYSNYPHGQEYLGETKLILSHPTLLFGDKGKKTVPGSNLHHPKAEV